MLATITLVTFACLLPQSPANGDQVAPERAQPLRVITYNVHAWGPVATSDAGQQRLRKIQSRDQLLPRLALELQLHQPDVIALQEAHSEAKVKELAALLKMDYAYFPGGWKGKGWREGISGAILSRPKIVARENRPSLDPKIPADKLFSRCLGRVVIERHEQQIAIYCAHMLPSWKQTTHIREAEIRALTVATNKDLQAGRSVIVMGDMNHDSAAPEYRLWAKAGLVDTARQMHQEKALLTCPSEDPKERIDFVFVAGPLKARLHRARALQEGAFMVRATLGSPFALSDHIPVFAEFR
ncbi:MAG: endonuclease/exonuclease/phosphatase family metal-dependent hydrolase [Planctomycetota bacterium]|jgi:endonuclease/exonuclease/phosphatase family metal-dependent hydrolase